LPRTTCAATYAIDSAINGSISDAGGRTTWSADSASVIE
jgi:hypothetical protein